MVKAKPKAYEEYTSPGGTERRLRLAPGTASGYYGVIKNKGKWQGMGYDRNKQSRRPLPGLHEKPRDAARQVALFDATFKDGSLKIPSPKKYAERGTGVCCAAVHPALPCLSCSDCRLARVGRHAREDVQEGSRREDQREHRERDAREHRERDAASPPARACYAAGGHTAAARLGHTLPARGSRTNICCGGGCPDAWQLLIACVFGPYDACVRSVAWRG
jgi:hypothetical protein